MGVCASICGGGQQDSGKAHGVGHNIRNFTNTLHVTEPALADQYRGVKQLGGGSAGEIWLCHNLSPGQPDVALKLFPRPFEAGSQDVLLRECQVDILVAQVTPCIKHHDLSLEALSCRKAC